MSKHLICDGVNLRCFLFAPLIIFYVFFMLSFYDFTLLLLSAIPSLRARDCSKNEKEALNYLFLLIPLLNITIPFFWKSFAVVWSADTIAFFGMYAWKVFMSQAIYTVSSRPITITTFPIYFSFPFCHGTAWMAFEERIADISCKRSSAHPSRASQPAYSSCKNK